MTLFPTVTGEMFGRSIKWAKQQPRLLDLLPNPIMNTYEIQNAINAAEVVSKPLTPKDTPVTITQETLSALLAGAKECVERRGY